MTDAGPRKIGPYEILGLLGRGGMANVYRAIQPSMERREVAIKVLPATFSQEATFLERFQREIRLVARLQHPRILPVYDSGDQEGIPYIVMALMTGGTLADRIDAAPRGMSLDDTARLVEQMAEGLDYAHRQGVIHRDFKPSNVLLDGEGNVHLADFGIAKATADSSHLTATGMVGTPAYMAPELSNSKGLSPLVDIYALGVTVYQMLTGLHPYIAETPVGMMMMHVTQPIPDVREFRPDLSADVQIVILHAMAKDPKLRYQTARALADDLRTVASGRPLDLTDSVGLSMPPEIGSGAYPVTAPAMMGATPPPSGTKAMPGPRRGGLPGWVIGGAAAALICLAAAVGALLVGLLSPQGLAGLFGGATATPATTPEPLVIVITSTPAPTVTPEPPTPQVGPAVTRIRFCDRPCTDAAARDMTHFPSDTSFIYVSMDFAKMKTGTAYTREWSNRGTTWVHYDCQWRGDPDMRRYVTLRDNTGGLRSGEWTLTVAIEGHVAAAAHVAVDGTNEHWNPLDPVNQPCPDWK